MAEFGNKKDNQSQFVQQPTFHGLESELLAMVESHRNSKKKHYPDCVPANPIDAVQWFIKLMPGQKYDEALRELTSKKGAKYWLWPYADRLKFLVKKFFSVDDELRSLVIAARQDRIEWRGDELEFFVMVIEETEEMHRIGVDAYRKQARPRIRAMILKMREKTKPKKQDVESNRNAALDYVESNA